MKILPLSDQFGTIIASDGDDDLFSCDHDTVVKLFQDTGAVWFRGFGINREAFKEFTNQYSRSFMPYIGGTLPREAIDGDETLLSVTGNRATFGIPLHGEMIYYANRPSLLWFYCENPPVKDGETTVCDGVAFYEALSESTKLLLQENKINFIREYPNSVWQKVYQTDSFDQLKLICDENNWRVRLNEDGSIMTESIYSAISPAADGQNFAFINNVLSILEREAKSKAKQIDLIRLEDHSPLPNEVIQEMKQVAERLTYSVVWERGDIVMVDNTRVMHGRNEFADDQRAILMRLCHLAN
jgi:alpha-ketoglutarate-dependent taurine dioxygenase